VSNRLRAAVVLENTSARNVRDDHVAKLAAGLLAQAKRRFTKIIRRDRRRDAVKMVHEGRRVHLRERARRRSVRLRVHLDAVVAAGANHDVGKLDLALVALVSVDGVVADKEGRDVLEVDGPAEHLEAVVEVEGDFAVFDSRARTNAGEGDAVDFVVLTDDAAAVPDANVLKRARALCRVSTTISLSRDTFDSLRASVSRCVAHDDETTPKATSGQFTSFGCRGEGDRSICRAHRADRRAGQDDKRGCKAAAIVRLAHDRHTRVDSEGHTGLHEHLAGHANARRPRCVR